MPIEWLRVWIIIRKAFVTLVTTQATEDFALCQIALDSLKQLAIKFLKKKELLQMQYQEEILKPFMKISGKPISSDLKEFIVVCMLNLVQVMPEL